MEESQSRHLPKTAEDKKPKKKPSKKKKTKRKKKSAVIHPSSPTRLDITNLAREHTFDALNTLIEIMHGEVEIRSRVVAAKALLERAWGKPLRSTSTSDKEGDEPRDESIFAARSLLDELTTRRVGGVDRARQVDQDGPSRTIDSEG